MMDKLSPILQWVNAHPEFSGFVTFFISAIESIAIIGTIIPGTVMMTAIGTLAGMGIIPLWATLFWAIMGAIVGDGVSYWLGRIFKDRLHTMWPFATRPYILENGERFFQKYGWMSVFIGRFVGPVRALVPLIAGMLNMPPLQFTIANVLSAIGWAPAYMLPGILLGAASLELPPDIALHVIMMLLATALVIALLLWLLHKIFKLIRNQINQLLTNIWVRLHDSQHFYIITTVLKHHDPRRSYGQLTLAFYFFLTCILLAYLSINILMSGSPSIPINEICFFFFRSLHTPTADHIMLAIAFLGEKTVLLPLIITLFAWLAYTKRWHTAWHVLALGVLSAAGVFLLKSFTHSLRPWGLLHNTEEYSFPSGHTTLAVTFYFGIALLLIKSLQLRSRKWVYYVAGLFVLLVSLSRLYLGVHWFTDILGGWLLGAAVLMLVLLSYNRKSEQRLYPTGIILTILITLTITYSASVSYNFKKLQYNYTQLDWPTYTITLNDWWNRQGQHLPLYRVNRFGLSEQVLNVQWIGDIDKIKAILMQNGWEVPSEPNWITMLHRISDVESSQHLPLVSPLYLDKTPVLVLVKPMNNKALIAFRLWDANLMIRGAAAPVWVGSVEIVPRTYSWIFKRRQKDFTVTPTLLFKDIPAQFEMKMIQVQAKRGSSAQQPIVLIKPR